MTVASALLLLVGLQTKHLVADYLIQTPYMFRNKGRYGHPGGLLHAGIHSGLTAALLGMTGAAWLIVFLLAALEFILHYHIDWAKETLTQKQKLTPNVARFWNLHGLDQWLHQLTYVAIVWSLAECWSERVAM